MRQIGEAMARRDRRMLALLICQGLTVREIAARELLTPHSVSLILRTWPCGDAVIVQRQRPSRLSPRRIREDRLRRVGALL